MGKEDMLEIYFATINTALYVRKSKELYETEGEAYNSYMRIIKEIGLENTDMRGLEIF